jgi:hypothetical protein
MVFGVVVVGKTIRIHLAAGKPTGIPLTELDNWIGAVLVGPRAPADGE